MNDRRPVEAATTPVERFARPFQEFAKSEASGGILLIACTVVALTWANSPWSGSYFHFWHADPTFGFGGRLFSQPLHFWINDGLMALFFLLVGLEIKREILIGELASFRKAALPIAAALGGMIVPAGLYVLFNHSGPGASGWGIPMATDIAFALGVLALLGDRVPLSLKVFLAALAIADDIGAVLVIAFFYTEQISWISLGVGGLFFVALIAANRAIRSFTRHWALVCGSHFCVRGFTPRLLESCWPRRFPRAIVQVPNFRCCVSSTHSCLGIRMSSCRCSPWRTRVWC
jgi:Na+:H+ antiporter, NhaA family